MTAKDWANVIWVYSAKIRIIIWNHVNLDATEDFHKLRKKIQKQLKKI